MRTLLKVTIAAAVVIGGLAFLMAERAEAQFGGPPAPPNTGIPLYTTMTGGDGSGRITVVVDPPKGTACYIMNVTGLDDITAAHIHTGGPGQDGGPVVMLDAPEGGTAGGCTPVTAEVANALIANPGGYYVNVHTRQAPAGAIRGQLSK